MTKEKFLNQKVEVREDGLWLHGLPLIETWEIPMLKRSVEEIVKRIHPTSVLEFGFGMGVTATAFGKLGIKRHVIIEPHPDILVQARKWATQGEGRELIEGFSQEIFPDEHFDLLYDDAYDFIGTASIPPDLSKYKCYWYARMAQRMHCKDTMLGFEFDVNGEPFHQSLIPNSSYYKCL